MSQGTAQLDSGHHDLEKALWPDAVPLEGTLKGARDEVPTLSKRFIGSAIDSSPPRKTSSHHRYIPPIDNMAPGHGICLPRASKPTVEEAS